MSESNQTQAGVAQHSSRQLWFSCGTAGELIKLSPLLFLAEQRARDEGLSWFFVSTGQSRANFENQWKDLGLPKDRLLRSGEGGEDLRSSSQALGWFVPALTLSGRKLRARLLAACGEAPEPGAPWVVHGDTLSTLVGALWARRLGARVAHVEAGLRSSSLLSPFPEELTRRWVSRLARMHFAPDARACRNLRKVGVRGTIVDTGGNTLYDAVELALEQSAASAAGAGVTASSSWPDQVPFGGPFALANLHRFENLNSRSGWELLVGTVLQAAVKLPVVWVLHPPTEAKLEEDPASRAKLQAAGVTLLPRLPFRSFLRLLEASAFVLSDGGSNQEECHYLGKPCLILRERSERFEGLEGGSCLLSGLRPELITAFLSDPDRYRRPPVRLASSPARRIMSALLDSPPSGWADEPEGGAPTAPGVGRRKTEESDRRGGSGD
jgi:UDP-N-acetylglucosamine 2-epimerase (non-hydrolysing)